MLRKCYLNDGTKVMVETVGEREILRRGEPIDYKTLNVKEQNTVDLIADIFEDGGNYFDGEQEMYETWEITVRRKVVLVGEPTA